jgi:hypothetical protein
MQSLSSRAGAALTARPKPFLGIVLLLAGTSSLPAQLVLTGNHRVYPAASGGSSEAEQRFGGALAVGDFDGNGVDDLAIGAPGATLDALVGVGFLQILYGWPPGWIYGNDFEGGTTGTWSAVMP